MNIYQVSFTAKKSEYSSSFTIVVDAHSKYEGDAIEEAKLHVNRHYPDVTMFEVKSVQFIETVQSRIDKINEYSRD